MHPKDIVMVTRVLEYRGPREWVNNVLHKSYISKKSPLGIHSPRSIRELSRTYTTIAKEETDATTAKTN